MCRPDKRSFAVRDEFQGAQFRLSRVARAQCGDMTLGGRCCRRLSGRITSCQNDAESWVPVAEWALELRRQGKAVLFVAHAGKSKQQRGTSKKDDVMDVVIKLGHTQDYQP